MQPLGPGVPAAPMYGAPPDLLPPDPAEFHEVRDLLRHTDRLTPIVGAGWLVAGAVLIPYLPIVAFGLLLVGGIAFAFFLVGAPRFLPMVDDGRFEDTKRELLPYSLFGLAGGVVPGLLFLVVRGKMTPLIVWQRQVLAATGAGPGGPQNPMYPPPPMGAPAMGAGVPPYGMPAPNPPPLVSPSPPPATYVAPPTAAPYVPPPGASPSPPPDPAPPPPAGFAPAYTPPSSSGGPSPAAPGPTPSSPPPRPSSTPPPGEFATYSLPTTSGGGPRSGSPSPPTPPPPSGTLPTPGKGFARVSATGPPACKTCGKPTTFVSAYGRYYCYACAQYA